MGRVARLFHPRFSPPQVSGPNLWIRLAFTPTPTCQHHCQPQSVSGYRSGSDTMDILGAPAVWLCPSMCCFLWCSVHLTAIVLWCSILWPGVLLRLGYFAGYCTLLQHSSVPFWLITVSTVFTWQYYCDIRLSFCPGFTHPAVQFLKRTVSTYFTWHFYPWMMNTVVCYRSSHPLITLRIDSPCCRLPWLHLPWIALHWLDWYSADSLSFAILYWYLADD